MTRYLSALVSFPLVSFLVAGSVYAQDEIAGRGPPTETVSLVWVVVFGVIFVGMIVGFFLYLWWNEWHSKKDD